MTLSTLLINGWPTVIFLFQTGSVPIWVPLTIILIIILIFWWGLTRNRIPEEGESNDEHKNEHSELESVDESSIASDEVKAEDGDEHAPDEDEAEKMAETEVDEPEIPSEADDFKIIEGIGPKIAAILADAGIMTYEQLASTDVSRLEQIVREDAGIKIANPASWPDQAALAAAGDWEGLEEMQHRLVAGRHRE